MKETPQSKAERFWDRTASRYDREERGAGKTSRQIIESSKNYLKHQDRVLDFGCGTGHFSNELAPWVKEVWGIDISHQMVALARKKAGARQLINVTHRQCELFDESLKPGSFDAILCFYILHLVEGPKVVVKRLKELLKPCGLVIGAVPCVGENRLLKFLFSIVGKLGLVPKIHYFRAGDVEQLLTAENFEIVERQTLVKASSQYFMVARLR